MIAEFAVVAVWLLAGMLVMSASGLRGWPTAPLGLLSGLAVYFAIGTVQVATPLPDHPGVALALCPAVAVAFALWRRRAGHVVGPPWGVMAGALTVAAIVVATTRTLHLFKWHVDTFEYLIVGTLMTEGHLAEATNSDYVSKRLLAVPMLHAPALWWDERYVRSITPLVALTCVGAVVWIVRRALVGKVDPIVAIAIPALAAAALVTNNRFVFHAFYLNGHMLVAALWVSLVGAAWLYVTRDPLPPAALVAIMGASAAAMVVTRPEGGLVAGLSLLPFLVTAQVTARHRALVLGALGVAATVWHGYSVMTHSQLPEPMSPSAVAYLALGLAAVVVAAMWWRGSTLGVWRRVPWAVEVVLWLALGAFVLRDSAIMDESLPAVRDMVAPNSFTWGSSLALLFTVALVVLLVSRGPGQTVLRYPLTTFVPLVFVLAYVRDGDYNSYSMDSLNRMLIEVVPLAVVFIAITVALGTARWRHR